MIIWYDLIYDDDHFGLEISRKIWKNLDISDNYFHIKIWNQNSRIVQDADTFNKSTFKN